MSDNAIQTSWNAGEWAPQLNARVDLEKYHSGAALLRNFFVDYRGGATTRPGTRYIATSRSTGAARLIPFQASFAVAYALEFGVVGSAGYLTFYNNSAPVLEASIAITSISAANPAVVSTGTPHGYATGDFVTIAGVATQAPSLNGGTYQVVSTGASTFTLKDLFGNVINTTGSGVGTGGVVQRVYTIPSPYQSSELAAIKFAQNVNQLVLCHPNYPPYILTLNSATNWTLAPITFGATVPPPTAGLSSSSTLSGGTVNYAYVVTSVDNNGQESVPSAFITIVNVQDIRSVAGSNTVLWTAVPAAASYNVYRANPRYGAAVPGGSNFGFMGNVTGTTFIDSNITPDFSQGPPVAFNPFSGSGIQSLTLTNPGSFAAGDLIPTISFSGGGGGSGAAAFATFAALAVGANNGGHGFAVGDTINLLNGILLQVTSVVTFGGAITGYNIISHGIWLAGSTIFPANPQNQQSTSGSGSGASFNITFDCIGISLTAAGSGYVSAPTVVFSSGSATATATIGAASAGNPTVPGFIQQRMILAGPVHSPSQMNFSQPGSPFNYTGSFPTQPDDAIQETLTNTSLNTIKALVPVSQGLITLSDKSAWL